MDAEAKSRSGTTWLFLAVGVAIGLGLGVIVSVSTDIPFAPEIGLVVGLAAGAIAVAIPGIGPTGPAVKLLSDFKFTEGPAADRAGNVCFSDIPDVRSLSESTGAETGHWMLMSGSFHASPRSLRSRSSPAARWRWPPSGRRCPIPATW